MLSAVCAAHIVPHLAGGVGLQENDVHSSFPPATGGSAALRARPVARRCHAFYKRPTVRPDHRVLLAIRHVLQKVVGILEPSYPGELVYHRSVVLAPRGWALFEDMDEKHLKPSSMIARGGTSHHWA
jgi:hypothetical protein